MADLEPKRVVRRSNEGIVKDGGSDSAVHMAILVLPTARDIGLGLALVGDVFVKHYRFLAGDGLFGAAERHVGFHEGLWRVVVGRAKRSWQTVR